MSACGRAQKLMEERDDGEHLRHGDAVFLGEHLKTCTACALEERAFAALRFAPEEPSHFPVTPDRRDEVVERALVAAAWPSPEERTPRRERDERYELEPWWQPILRPRFALAMAGVTAGLLALFVIARPSSAEAVPGTVVLASAVDGARAGKPVVLDEEVVAERGELMLALGRDVVAVLEPGSRVRVHRLDTAGIDLALVQGLMHLSATPGALAEALTVAVPKGRVIVTGTIFSVDASATRSNVRVQRGSVRVEPKAGASAVVKAGHGRGIGSGIEQALGPEETSRALEAVGRAERLARAPEGAIVVVAGEPAGADVVVGGVRLGAAPLSLRLPPGVTSVEVLVDGERVKSESVTLENGMEKRIEYRVERDDMDVEDALALPDEDLLEEAPPTAKRARQGRRGAPAVEEAEAMLERAQNLRAERRWAATATMYRQLIRRFPQQPAARIARVSLGTLLLDHLGRPKEALALCSEYLRSERGGIVAQEAAYCQIGAFRALGREEREREAIEAFLSRYPGAVQLEELRARLKELSGP